MIIPRLSAARFQVAYVCFRNAVLYDVDGDLHDARFGRVQIEFQKSVVRRAVHGIADLKSFQTERRTHAFDPVRAFVQFYDGFLVVRNAIGEKIFIRFVESETVRPVQTAV